MTGPPPEGLVGQTPLRDDGEDRQVRIAGLHLVRIPVADVWVSRDWYTRVLGLVPVMDVEQEDRVVGVVLRHPEGFAIGLHLDARRAADLAGFALLGLTVTGKDELERWGHHLDRMGLAHRDLSGGISGGAWTCPIPTGILVRLHAGPAPYVEEA